MLRGAPSQSVDCRAKNVIYFGNFAPVCMCVCDSVCICLCMSMRMCVYVCARLTLFMYVCLYNNSGRMCAFLLCPPAVINISAEDAQGFCMSPFFGATPHHLIALLVAPLPIHYNT